MDDDPIGYVDTMFEYYLPGVDTSQLTDEAWAKKFAQLSDIRKRENEQNPYKFS